MVLPECSINSLSGLGLVVRIITQQKGTLTVVQDVLISTEKEDIVAVVQFVTIKLNKRTLCLFYNLF